MALFGNKKEEKKEEATEVVAEVIPQIDNGSDLSHVLSRPRITEKATASSMKGVYVFNVAPSATKPQIKAAVRALYKVEPVKVRIVNMPKKSVRNARTGVWGTKGGGKKAYVQLKDGESISIM